MKNLSCIIRHLLRCHLTIWATNGSIVLVTVKYNSYFVIDTNDLSIPSFLMINCETKWIWVMALDVTYS
jgi:hypothetical protein